MENKYREKEERKRKGIKLTRRDKMQLDYKRKRAVMSATRLDITH